MSVSLDVQALDALRQSGAPLVVLDVREPWELDICGFTDALSIPLQTLPQRVAEVPTDRPVVVVCHHGMRSMQAVNWLRRNGYENVSNLDGGIDAWARAIDTSMGVY